MTSSATCILVQAPASPKDLFAAACAAAGLHRIPRKQRKAHGGTHGEKILHAAGDGVAVTMTYAPGGGKLHQDPLLKAEPDGYAEIVFSASIEGDDVPFHQAAANATSAWLLERQIPWSLQFMDGPWKENHFPVRAARSRSE